MQELAKALNEFQAELVTVGKNSDNPFFKSKYADLADIMKATQPVLTKHGLSVLQLPDNIDGKPALKTIVMHTSGQAQEGTVPLILAKDDPQGVGSAITYMRRYGYAAALQIVIDEDDDGNKASSTETFKQQAVSKAKSFNNNLASEKQRQLIRDKLNQKGIADEEMKEYLIEQYGINGQMTKDDASMVIDDLIGASK